MDYKTVLTTCTHCGCGCSFYLEVLDGEIIGTIPCKTSPVNEGKLCIKGWNVHQFIQNEKRPAYPVKPQSATQMDSPGVPSHRHTVHGR